MINTLNNLPIIFNSNTLPSIPTNPKEIYKFIQEQLNYIMLEKALMCSSKNSLKDYKFITK